LYQDITLDQPLANGEQSDVVICRAVKKFSEMWYSTKMVDIWQCLPNHLQSRTLAHTHTCSIDPAILGSNGGRLLLESSGVWPSHSIWCPPWLRNASTWGPFSE